MPIHKRGYFFKVKAHRLLKAQHILICEHFKSRRNAEIGKIDRLWMALPKRFEVSVWRGGQLYGLSYGRPSYKKTRLRIELIESSPVRDCTAVKEVFPIINIAAQYYAIALGAEEIRIINPVNDKVVEHYSKFGYTFVETSGK